MTFQNQSSLRQYKLSKPKQCEVCTHWNEANNAGNTMTVIFGAMRVGWFVAVTCEHHVGLEFNPHFIPLVKYCHGAPTCLNIEKRQPTAWSCLVGALFALMGTLSRDYSIVHAEMDNFWNICFTKVWVIEVDFYDSLQLMSHCSNSMLIFYPFCSEPVSWSHYYFWLSH